MNRRLLTIALCLLLLPSLVQAQQPEVLEARHNIKLNLLSPLLFSTPSVGYEYRLNNHLGAEVDLAGTIFKQQNKLLEPYAMMAQAQCRFYLNKQWRHGGALFLAVGANYIHAWEYADLFVRNEGWDIITEPYTIRDDVLRPSLMLGLKINTSIGLTIENTLGILLINIFIFNNGDHRLAFSNLELINNSATIFTTRIGWAF